MILLVVQGLTLPAVIRFSRAEHDPAEDLELRTAERAAAAAAVMALPRRAAELGVPEGVLDEVRDAYEATLHRQHAGTALEAGQITDPDLHAATRSMLDEADAERALLLALVADKREAVVLLRERHVIDDGVVRRMHCALDSEEVLLVDADEDD